MTILQASEAHQLNLHIYALMQFDLHEQVHIQKIMLLVSISQGFINIQTALQHCY